MLSKRRIFLSLTIIMIIISLIPIPRKFQNQSKGWDKMIHFLLYGIWGFIGQSVLSIGALLLGSFLSLLTELVQKFIPSRVPEIADFTINILGLVMGTSFWELIARQVND
ncbi:MAG: VanZ family protein [candidate division WOR-3 bacterium]|nr:VanZ family protein [candidate division WOR-3 bacterium]